MPRRKAAPQDETADFLADNEVWMYGTRAPEVLAVLDRLEEMGPQDGRLVADAWQAVPKADRENARKVVKRVVLIGGDPERYLQIAREAVGTWLAVAVNRPEFLKADPDWPAASARVAEAAMDAITALVIANDLDPDQVATFAEPWAAAGESGQTPAGQGEPDDEDEDEDEEGKYGPNTDAVVNLLNRLWLLTPEQVSRIVVRWQNSPAEDLRVAHEMVHDLVDEDSEWREQVKAAQEALSPWLNSGRIADNSGFLGHSGRNDVRRMAGPVLADAVAALVLGDLLEPEDAATLYAPWFEQVGAPPLPDTHEGDD